MFTKLAPLTFTRQVRKQFDDAGFLVTSHGIAGMWHRRIDPSFVAETCLVPEQTEPDEHNENVEVLFRKFRNQTLRVVVGYDNGRKSIISVTWRGWLYARVGKASRR